jgi:hypothetical protein
VLEDFGYPVTAGRHLISVWLEAEASGAAKHVLLLVMMTVVKLVVEVHVQKLRKGKIVGKSETILTIWAKKASLRSACKWHRKTQKTKNTQKKGMASCLDFHFQEHQCLLLHHHWGRS